MNGEPTTNSSGGASESENSPFFGLTANINPRSHKQNRNNYVLN